MSWQRRTSLRRKLARFLGAIGIVVLGAAGSIGGVARQPAQAADPWLFVNDVHYDIASRKRRPNGRFGDPNSALVDSLLREMQRLAPNPPVIVMAGDFLAHHVSGANAIPTITTLARRFGAAFPHAQFVIALGNEDSGCGDYALTPNSPFLRAAAAAWAPLVERNGAAPDFVRTFARDGFYTAKLPLANVRAVIVDDAFWSPFYHDGCGVRADPTPAAFEELDRALHPVGDERMWLIMHIPPGIDASSTVRLIHHLAIVPFLRPGPRERVVELIADSARRVELVVTGHVHRFAYRIVERKGAPPVPILVSPAVSPILGNLPSFLTADVAADGIVRNLEEHSYVDGHWRDIGGLGNLGVSEFTGPALVNLQHRLEHDAALQEKYAELYMGDSPYHEIAPGAWRSYWCAATALNSTAFRDCLNEGGFSFLTRRGVAVVAFAVVFGALFLVALGIRLRRRRLARHSG